MQLVSVTKRPFIVQLFVVSFFVILIVFGSSSKQTLPQDTTIFAVLNLLTAIAIGWVPILSGLAGKAKISDGDLFGRRIEKERFG